MKQEMNSERRLEEIAVRLGSDAGRRFDPEATAGKVLGRLRESDRIKSPFYKSTRVLLRVAAVAVLAIGIGVMSQQGGPVVETMSAPLELADLSDAELTEVMDSLLFDEPVAELASGSLYDLTETELAELLELMEG